MPQTHAVIVTAFLRVQLCNSSRGYLVLRTLNYSSSPEPKDRASGTTNLHPAGQRCQSYLQFSRPAQCIDQGCVNELMIFPNEEAAATTNS